MRCCHLQRLCTPLEELKRVSSLHPAKPRHPEVGVTPGWQPPLVQLGQGLANAVGMALAEQCWSAEVNRQGSHDRRPPDVGYLWVTLSVEASATKAAR